MTRHKDTKVLHLHLDPKVHRRFRLLATASGLTNADFFELCLRAYDLSRKGGTDDE
jgi:hypothetical protein